MTQRLPFISLSQNSNHPYLDRYNTVDGPFVGQKNNFVTYAIDSIQLDYVGT